MSIMNATRIAVLFAVLPVSLSAAVRVFQYEEVKVRSNVPSAAASHQHTPRPTPRAASASLEWTKPKEWVEQRGSGMRLATFSLPDADHQAAAECSVIVLAGAAGGVAANVERWIGQLNLSLPEGETLESFLSQQTAFRTATDDAGILVDLSSLPVGADDETASMIVGMITLEQQTLFFKLMGPRGLLASQKGNLLSLCSSVKSP